MRSPSTGPRTRVFPWGVLFVLRDGAPCGASLARARPSLLAHGVASVSDASHCRSEARRAAGAGLPSGTSRRSVVLRLPVCLSVSSAGSTEAAIRRTPSFCYPASILFYFILTNSERLSPSFRLSDALFLVCVEVAGLQGPPTVRAWGWGLPCPWPLRDARSSAEKPWPAFRRPVTR